MTAFADAIEKAYGFEGGSLELGRGVHEGKLEKKAAVRIPLATTNRHGLIAGATGTGKTKSLQVLAEQLSAVGVSVFAADMKGDLSGLVEPAPSSGPAEQRMKELGLPFEPNAFPVEFLSLGGIGAGLPIRATVSDYGPQLLAKVLKSNETQEQSLALVFRYADENGLPLLDLADLRALLTFLDSDAGKESLRGIGGVSSATIGVLLRALVGLEDGGGKEFFGEPQFDIADLLRAGPDGRGVISCLELPAVQDKPELFSTTMMWLLAELFEELPEVGDIDKPKLVFFFDEAHLLFDEATDAFLDSVVKTVRLIRSKGVGVYFITQQPTDIPRDVLGQLGNRVQHALRAFTPEDADALKQTIRTYPKSEFYDLEELLTSLGIGEAAVTILDESGVPTPVVHTRMRAPTSSMDVSTKIEATASTSAIAAKYAQRVDRDSARERLAARMAQPATPTEAREPRPEHKKAADAVKGGTDMLGDFLGSKEGRRLQREVFRGVFGMLKKRL
jgi:uncharacterized protein